MTEERKAGIALVTGSYPPDKCGVGDYTKKLFEELSLLVPVELAYRPIRSPFSFGLFSPFKRHKLVHVEYPTEGWGNSLLPTFLPLARALLGRRTKLLLTLHEWSQMNPLRRKSILPLIRFSDGFIFVSPSERQAFGSSAPAGARSKPTWHIPIGVNLDIPSLSTEEIVAFRARELEAGKFDLLLTHFGFIHAGKQPYKLLEAVSSLRRLGRKPKLTFVGGFQLDKDDEAKALRGRIAELGQDGAVEMKGFVEDERLAALFMATSDVNISLFSDGLSSRRGSFWYATQHGCHVITTAPQDPKEFEDLSVLSPPHILFVEPDCSADALASVVADLPAYEPYRFEPTPVARWSDIAKAHVEVYKSMLGEGSL